MQICKEGKQAITEFKILEYFPKINATLLLCKPLTGRQHQIRVHLHYKNHTILGDPLYGLSKEQIESILDEKLSPKERLKLTGALRLCLHSYRLKFQYKIKFDINSKINIKEIFNNSIK